MYQTDTLTLAAYLKAWGYELISHKTVQVFKDNGNGFKLRDRTIFSFTSVDGIEERAEDFRKGKAFGNINDYEAARRELMGIVKGL